MAFSTGESLLNHMTSWWPRAINARARHYSTEDIFLGFVDLDESNGLLKDKEQSQLFA